MCLKKIKNIIFIITSLTILTSCETIKKTYEVLKNPDIRVGDRLDQQSQYSLSIFTTGRININRYSENEDASLDFNNTDNVSDEQNYEHEEKDFSDSREKITDNSTHGAVKKSPPTDDIKKIIDEQSNGDAQATPVLIRVFQLSEKSLFLSATYDDLNDENYTKGLGKTYVDHQDFMLEPNQFRFIENKPVEKKVRYIAVVAYFNNEVNREWKDLIKIKPNGEIYPVLIRVTENNIKIHKDN